MSYGQVVVIASTSNTQSPTDVAFASKDGLGISASANATADTPAANRTEYPRLMQRFVDAVLAALP